MLSVSTTGDPEYIEKRPLLDYFREGRKGIDLVNDGVENSLMREVDNIKSCQDKMKRTLEQVNHQLGVNRNTRHQIERDLANKDHSINIDHTCHNLQNTSRAINLHGGIEKVDPNISIPETWADFSNRNIQASQCKCNNIDIKIFKTLNFSCQVCKSKATRRS